MTASIVLNLRPGARLAPEQVRGIVHLVSSSVEGLNPDRVTIIDTSGKLIARPADSGLGQTGSRQFEMQAGVEAELERRVRTMLDEILGPNKATVRVAAQMDFTSVERTEERFDPQGVIKSEQRTSETQHGSTTTPVAVAGVASNVPDRAAAQSQSGQSTTKTTREAETIQYDVSKVLERKVVAPGELKRLSVAVMVDGTYNAVADGKGGERKEYVPRKAEELEKIKSAVKNAIGFNASRGDEVEVAEYPFDTSAMEKERVLMEEAERQAFWYSLAKQALMAVGLLLVLLFVLRPLLRTFKGRRQPGSTGDTQAAMSLMPPRPTAISGGSVQPPALDLTATDPLRDGLMELANKQPNVVAQLVRAWIVKKP